MIRIQDVSNSIERPPHRGSRGPIENDILADLKRHAHRFDAEFVDEHPDVFLTNDVFPSWVLETSTPKAKRMDGVFFTDSTKARNEAYNRAAKHADVVVFNSKYSYDSYMALYGDALQSTRIVLNKADPHYYYRPARLARDTYHFVAAASDWSRPEKRLPDLIVLALCAPQYAFHVIGKCEATLPTNCVKHGYLGKMGASQVMRECDAGICLAYRDAAPKTVAQFVASGLPVLYAASGGVPEMVTVGVPIPDRTEIVFEDAIPGLSINDMRSGLSKIVEMLPRVVEPNFREFEDMISAYFSAIRDAATVLR